MTAKELKYGHTIAGKIFFMKQFDALGIQKRYLGYYMLIEIMEVLINKDSKIVSFSKQVYPIIAQKFSKKICTVERNIRNLIDRCWNENIIQKLNIKNTKVKPSCLDFVYMIKDFIADKIM